MRLILYSKPGCHLCEGLQAKLENIQAFPLDLEIRDITTRDAWFQAYEYEIPVLFLEQECDDERGQENRALIPIPRPSPRVSVRQLERQLEQIFQRLGVRKSENRAE